MSVATATASDDIESLTSEQLEKTAALPPSTMIEDKKDDDAPRHKEDPATVAASEELRHTSISDRGAGSSKGDDVSASMLQVIEEDKDMVQELKAATPERELSEAQDEEMRERLSSPKKKRGRDHDDQEAEAEADDLGSSADGSVVNGGRSTRLEPEKKRPRDGSEDRLAGPDEVTKSKGDVEPPKSPPKGITISEKKPNDKPTSGDESDDKVQTSKSAFASSGFASLASSPSPFGQIGAAKPSVFGGNNRATSSGFGSLSSSNSLSSTSTATTSGFGALAGDKPKIGFGFGSGSSSGFSGLGGGSAFGSGLSNGFSGGTGQKLSSFAAPGAVPDASKGAKPLKAFGAPESDEEGSTDEDSSDGVAGSDGDEAAPVVTEEKKRNKPAKVQVEDGEAGEATILQVRAKLFAVDKEAGWKQRGVGTLKINVPEVCVSYNEDGQPIPGSFDASGLEDEDKDSAIPAPRVARLILRQENTHRVVLNTIIVRAMEFRDKPGTGAAQILFTAFEGPDSKPVNMLLKMTESNAKLFRAELESIQREL